MILIRNKKAAFDYFFIKEFNAGIQLTGSEAKQIRARKVSIVDAFCYINNDELFLKDMNVTATEDSFSHEPLRLRKLLLKKSEINKIKSELNPGITIVVKSLFVNDRNFIKVEIAIAKGKKNYDKREVLKEKEINKQLLYVSN